MLQIRNITKIFRSGNNKIVALNDISIDFPETGLVFIVGKSGAGKSTLLNILGGLDNVDNGEIFIDGESTKKYTAKDFDSLRNYKIGFIFQEFNLLDDDTVYDNIALSLKMQAKGHDVTTIDEALKLVNLEGLGYRKISELSGGQKQRIAIARALIKNPSIILADEPTGALDSKTGFELMSSLKKLSENKLVIVVSHDYDMAYYFADKLIYLNDGKVLKVQNRIEKNKEDNIIYYGNNILKITSGNTFDDPDSFNKLLNKDTDNCICINLNPESITIAHPDKYDKIFKIDNFKLQFKEDNATLKEISNDKHAQVTKIKAKLKISECFKMAFQSYKKSVGRIVFLLLFTIISISMLGTSLSLSITSTEKIIANTLKNNDISLGIMQKKDSREFDETDLELLKNNYPNTSFAMGKTIDIAFGQAINANNSPFAMDKFTGIVECDNITSLNLKILEGKDSFDENSLLNNEIIISDYAAYELQRKGYYGNNIDGYYSINKPKNYKDIIGTSILLRKQNYKIIGIFDTNFEDYLSLLVDSTYENSATSDDMPNQKVSSLETLKSYYYAKIIAPNGFYKNMYYNNSTQAEKELYSIYSKTVMVYDAISDDYIVSKKDIAYSNFNDFSTFDNTNCSIVYEKEKDYLKNILTSGGLKSNQIVINSDLLTMNGINIGSTEQVMKFVDTLSTLYVSKIDGYANPISTVYQGNFEIVAIVHFNDSVLEKMFFSKEMVDRLESSKFSYNQMLFSLNGNLYSYEKLIKTLNKNYSVLNIDGKSSISNTSSIESYKTISLIISGIFMIFSFLIVLNFVSTNVKSRKKEIGILRANGARKKDILNIFVIEEGIITLIVSLASIFIVYNLSNILNNIFGNMAIGIQLVVFDFIIVSIILGITLLLITLSTIIPVLQIASLRPIDAIRNN